MNRKSKVFSYGMDKLTPGIALDICSGITSGVLKPAAVRIVARNRKLVESMVTREKPVYGINTGFGPLCSEKISPEETKELQSNLLQSHCVGMGKPVSREVVRLMLILKVHSLARGNSGVRPELMKRILFFLDKDICPVVPSQGSLGASGDLAPLAHLFLPFIGLGKVIYRGREVSSSDAHRLIKVKPLSLEAKEGLALINGTQFIAAHAVKVVERLQNCLDHADIIGAMTLEALLGSAEPFQDRLHKLRPFPGAAYVAKRLRVLLSGSEILKSHRDCGRVQDPYSLRCMPQVHGASRDAWKHLKDCLLIEMNAVTDNPVVFNDGGTVSGGNFHGQPIALPLDYAALAAAELGSISDRRIYLSLEGKTNGLPKLLLENTGVNSGFMMPQYTSAALASENKSLCFPASADSIPTSLGQEDHVSMGSIAGRKTLRITGNLEKILGIELFCAAQAFDYRKPLKSTPLLNACHEYVRSRISHVRKDRMYARDMEESAEIIKSGKLAGIINDLLENEQNEKYGIY